jgi:hypothetical protein
MIVSGTYQVDDNQRQPWNLKEGSTVFDLTAALAANASWTPVYPFLWETPLKAGDHVVFASSGVLVW